jgi:hypothetical protein
LFQDLHRCSLLDLFPEWNGVQQKG